MKVYEVIEALKKMPQDLEIITAGDDEGNSFRHIHNDWISVEKFDDNMDLYAEEDYEEFGDDLKEYVLIG
jgi:hypothetical protein